jgi:glycosyltransferase involved in cell wall biosynthesis
MTAHNWSADGVSVVIPVYNEQDGIGPTLDAVRTALHALDLPSEIVVVDDGSTDETPQRVAAYEHVKLIRHAENRGVGAARNTGIVCAAYQAIVMIDGDATYPAAEIPLLINGLTHYHMMVGARTGRHVAKNILRALPKWFIRKLACYISGSHIPDLNSGLRAFRKSSVVRFFNILPKGHSWVSTITLAMLSNGLAVKFVPVDYHRRIGRSTFHPFIDTYNYLFLVVRTIMYFDPLKVFLPAGAFLFLAGAVKLVHGYVVWQDIRDSDIILIVVSLFIIFQGLLADLIVAQTKLRSITEEND